MKRSMQGLVVCCVLLIAGVGLIAGVDGVGLSVKDKSVRDAFREWSGNFGEGDKFGLQSGDIGRYKIFEKNFNYISRKAEEGLGFEMELNKFTGMSEEELDSYTGLNVTEVADLGGIVSRPRLLSSSSTPIAHSVDHRRKTGLSQPRSLDQVHCAGSSWAHAVVAVLESRYKVLTDEISQFSEQELVDCAYSDGRNGCKGGFMTPGFQYVQDVGRLADRRRYRVWGGSGSCAQRYYKNAMSRAEVTGFQRLEAGEDNLRREVSESGPVSVAIYADRSLFFYKYGLYDGSQCSNGDVNHAVTAVGYLPDRWIIKNCWGTGWGSLNGYAYLSRKYANVCKIANYAVTATLRLSSVTKDGSEDWCVYVPEPDREPCWADSWYTTTQYNCEKNDCCWDPTTRTCFVKAKITLYQERYFQGVSATFYGSIPDLQAYDMSRVVHSIKVHHGNFMVYSKTYYGAAGKSWENYSLGVLTAGSTYDNLDEFSFSHAISSFRALSSGRDVITMFDHTHARGPAIAYYRAQGWVGKAWNDGFSSAFTKGRWAVCEDSNFKGDCQTVTSGLTRYLGDMNDEISSLRSLD